MTVDKNEALERELFKILDEFENAHLMLTALAESACAATAADMLPKHFDAGLDMLFKHALGIMDQATERNRMFGKEIMDLLRHERLPAAPDNRPMVMRDQFIAECVRQGHAVADIAQALGLPSTSIERTIRRLQATAEHEAREATA